MKFRNVLFIILFSFGVMTTSTGVYAQGDPVIDSDLVQYVNSVEDSSFNFEDEHLSVAGEVTVNNETELDRKYRIRYRWNGGNWQAGGSFTALANLDQQLPLHREALNFGKNAGSLVDQTIEIRVYDRGSEGNSQHPGVPPSDDPVLDLSYTWTADSAPNPTNPIGPDGTGAST